jgi:tryptophan 2,3-dioxygenase
MYIPNWAFPVTLLVIAYAGLITNSRHYVEKRQLEEKIKELEAELEEWRKRASA